MAGTPQDSGTVRKSGVIRIGWGDSYNFSDILIANSSGFISLVAKDTGGNLYGGQASWAKGAANLIPYAHLSLLPEYVTANGGITRIGVAPAGNEFGFYFSGGGDLRILNNLPNPFDVDVAYDIVMITH